MKPLKIWILFIALSWLNLAGNVTIHVSSDTVHKGDPVEVTLTAEGKQIVFPTIDAIGRYPIDAPKISQKIEASYLNGTFKSIRRETMRFAFFPENNITIPSLKIQVDGKTRQTRPVSITVLPPDQSGSNKDGYRLQMITTRQSVYVAEAFALQVIFFEPRNSNVAQAQYIAPKFDGFFVKSSSKERLENTPEGTKHIFDYILTPQKEGNFTITAPVIKLGIQTFSGVRDPWGFFNNEVHWKSLQASPKIISVKPLPHPADLVGNFTIAGAPDATTVEVNKPVNFTLTLKGEGSLDDIDAPKIDIPGVTIYSDDARSDVQISGNRIISHWEKKYTFIADRDFTIPAISFSMFNPRTGQSSTLTTNPSSIHVTGGSLPASTPKSTVLPPKKSAAPSSSVTQLPVAAETKRPDDLNRSLFEDTSFYDRLNQQKEWALWPWWSLLLSFIGGVFLTSVWFGLRKKIPLSTHKKSHRKYTPDEALSLLYPHLNDSPEIEAMVRDLYRIKNGEKLPLDHKKIARLIQETQKHRS